jgi:multicomponent Na+:H+ antiporter subunit D
MIPNNTAALAPLFLLLAGISIPLVGFRFRRLAHPLSLFATLLAAAVSIANAFRVVAVGTIHYHFGGWPPPIGIAYVLDPLSAFMTAVINSIAFIVLIQAGKTTGAELEEGKEVPYYALVMLFLCGSNGIILTGDFFNLYVFLEISSLALYGLIAVGDKKSPISAFRYLIMGTVGGCFYLLGTGFLYMTTGSLNMADVAQILPALGSQPAAIVALCLMVLGLGIKMALFPLHGWLPDAYTHAPSASSSIMAPIGIKIGAYGLLRILFFVFGINFIGRTVPLTDIIAWMSAAGIIYGSILAMTQNELKRMLAYSSVSQIGYIGLGLGLANPMGLIGAVLHVLNHGLMKACLFLVAGNFRIQLGHSRIDKMDDTLRKRMPWTSAAFVAGATAMIGIPPTVGFFSKWYLALGTISGRKWHFLAVILLSSLLNAIYFFRVIEKMYLRPINGEGEDKKWVKSKEAGLSMLLPTLVLALLLFLVGLLNSIIVKGILFKILPPGIG